MTCPKCEGKVTVTDSVHNSDTNETYRYKECLGCGRKFYTIEFEVDVDDKFMDEWYKHHRSRGRAKTHVGRYK